MAAFVDSHAHLADPAFGADVDETIDRARATGAAAVVCIGESPETADRAREIARRHPGFLWHTAGVHPHDAERFDAGRDMPRLREHLASGAVAVGECGLDYFYDNAPREAQRRVFEAQIALAAEARRPIVVHTRQAEDDTTALVAAAAQAGVRGVLHCFTGTIALAEHAVASGWFVSFSGIVTFKKWTDEDLLRAVPDDRLLVESDAPYLAPVPHRGKRNEPAYVSLTLARVAAARDVTAEALGSHTVRNAALLFDLAIGAPPT
jgi:TatD DNase family protein